MIQFKEFIRFFFGVIIGLFVGPMIVCTMIILVIIFELRGRRDNNVPIKSKTAFNEYNTQFCFIVLYYIDAVMSGPARCDGV